MLLCIDKTHFKYNISTLLIISIFDYLVNEVTRKQNTKLVWFFSDEKTGNNSAANNMEQHFKTTLSN